MGLIGSWALSPLGKVLKLDICVHGNLAVLLPSNSSWAHPVAVAEAGPFVRDPTWLGFVLLLLPPPPPLPPEAESQPQRVDEIGAGEGTEPGQSLIAVFAPLVPPRKRRPGEPSVQRGGGREAEAGRQADEPLSFAFLWRCLLPGCRGACLAGVQPSALLAGGDDGNAAEPNFASPRAKLRSCRGGRAEPSFSLRAAAAAEEYGKQGERTGFIDSQARLAALNGPPYLAAPLW